MKHLKKFNESDNFNISNYKKTLIDIDNRNVGYKYYVVYIRTSEKISSWTHNGIFRGFSTHEEVLSFIDELAQKGIKSIKILSPEEYNSFEKIRKQGQ